MASLGDWSRLFQALLSTFVLFSAKCADSAQQNPASEVNAIRLVLVVGQGKSHAYQLHVDARSDKCGRIILQQSVASGQRRQNESVLAGHRLRRQVLQSGGSLMFRP